MVDGSAALRRRRRYKGGRLPGRRRYRGGIVIEQLPLEIFPGELRQRQAEHVERDMFVPPSGHTVLPAVAALLITTVAERDALVNFDSGPWSALIRGHPCIG